MDLALGQVILLLVVSCLAGGASSSPLKVSSTGAAARIQAEKMGNYRLTSRTQNSRPVYEQTNGDNFLYVSSLGVWSVGRTEGAKKSGLYNPQSPAPSEPPTSGWLYSNLPNGWGEDATLTVVSESASQAGTRVAQGTAAATAANVSVDLNGLLLTIRVPQAPAPRTAVVVPATPDTPTANETTADTPTAVSPRTAAEPAAEPAAPTVPCPASLVVSITADATLPNNPDFQYAHRNFRDYSGTYRRMGLDLDNNVFYTRAPTPTPTQPQRIRRVRVTGDKWRWEMTGPAISRAAFAEANDPHLINDSESDCPPRDGWRFLTGPDTYSPTPDPKVIVRP